MAQSMVAKSVAVKFEELLKDEEQVHLATHHVLHGGMYARTVLVQKGVAIVGAEIKVPTIVIINGKVDVNLDDGFETFTGYHVLAASMGRKQVFIALEDTYITMMLATDASRVCDAEQVFTDDYDRLASRSSEANNIEIITGE